MLSIYVHHVYMKNSIGFTSVCIIPLEAQYAKALDIVSMNPLTSTNSVRGQAA